MECVNTPGAQFFSLSLSLSLSLCLLPSRPLGTRLRGCMEDGRVVAVVAATATVAETGHGWKGVGGEELVEEEVGEG